MWTGYSARDAAQLIGLPEAAVQSWIREGLVGAPTDDSDEGAKLSFRDLTALQTVKALVDSGASLSQVRAELAKVRVRSPGTAFRTSRRRSREVNQLLLPFLAESASEVSVADIVELPRDPDGPLSIAPPATADQWLSRAQVLEARDAVAAIDAYRRSLRLRPDCSEAWINLGRLLAETNDSAAAEACFKSALDLDPDEPTAHYNLGVLAQDAGETAEAVALYRKSLDLDPTLAEAHYNLATLFDQSGDSQSAIRHINEYRKLRR